jgi:Protein of unknown function (DUF2934)
VLRKIWGENHRPDGRDDEFWHQAERELQRAEDYKEPAKATSEDI